MKKQMIFWIAMVVVFMALPVMAWASPAPESDFEFYANTGNITKYLGSESNVEIPESIGGHKVLRIGEFAFSKCKNLTGVTIPGSVTSIGDYAFANCENLTEISIPSSVTKIWNSAFSGCEKLTGIKVDSENKKYDSRENCNAVIETESNTLVVGCQTTVIPSSVKNIGDYSFYGRRKMTEINIPSSVISIGDYAFADCVNLTGISIPSSMTSMGSYTFARCERLTSIKVDSGNKKYDSRENCNAIIETQSNTLIAGCQTTVIPSSVRAIGDNAFNTCTSLTEMSIPSSVASIGDYSFEFCENLTKINIVSGVTNIGDWAFDECTSLTEISIPSSVSSIGEGAFAGCTSLAEISIPSSVTSIGDLLFKNCSSLASIKVDSENKVYDSRENCNAVIETGSNTLVAGCHKTVIPSSVSAIGDWAFYECKSLTEISIPIGVTEIGSRTFVGCESLSEINISSSVTSIDGSAFQNCSSLAGIKVDSGNRKYDSRDNCNAVIEKESNTLVLGGQKTIIPSSVRVIGYDAFKGRKSLAEISIPSGVTDIRDSAFADCESLSKISIPFSVADIWYNAFWGCAENLTFYVQAGSYAETYAKEYEFSYEYKSADSNIESTKITKIVLDQSMVNLKKGDTLLLRASLVPIEAENQPLLWSSSDTTVASVENGLITANKEGNTEIKVEAKNDNKIFALCKVKVVQEIENPEGNVNPPGKNPGNPGTDTQPPAKGDVSNPSVGDEPSGSLPVKGEKLTDSKTKAVYTVTKPGSAVAYAGTTNKKAVSLSVPSTIKIGGKTYKVTSVAKNALKNNKKLQKITISGNVSDIGAGAFQGCTALKTVKMGSKVTSIGDKAFYGCKKLSSLTIGKKVSAIGKSAFQNCTALKKVTIPDKVKKIGGKAFSGCKKLTGITVKSKKLTEKNVGSKAFEKAGSSNYKKVKVTVPAKKYAAYKKLLKKKGLSKKAKIVKK